METNTKPVSIEDVPLNSFHQRLTISCALGWLLVGYVVSIIGVASIQLKQALHLSESWSGIIGGSALIGMFMGGFIGGTLTDRFGRQKLYFVFPTVVIICSLLMFVVQNGATLLILRIITGLTVGIEYTAAGSLLTEFLPKAYRGSRVSMLSILWFGGAALAYVVGYLILGTHSPQAWRFILASPAIIGAITLLFRVGAPESARWLISKNRPAEAEQTIKSVFGEEFSLRNLETGASSGKSLSLGEAIKKGYGKRIFFVMAFWASAVIPVFAVYAFVPELLESLKLTGSMTVYGSVGVTATFVVGCWGATKLIDYIGRRTMLLHSLFWSGIALLALGIFPTAPAWIILIFFCFYAVMTGGAQVLEFVYPNELFPTEIRASAVGIGSSTSSFSSAIGTWLVPIALNTIGIGNTMLVAAGITFAGFAISYMLAPETRSMSLEQASSLS
ncbi:MFS transporter [Acetobacteraceae bacterium ESL0709]|nr:MFS transporter [Acetobacteraceae bacterium ESL0697]MDF7678444.1 MFS transporter [Acetobacteraceae bacterium ESL0709]